jgi:hypothetical protein
MRVLKLAVISAIVLFVIVTAISLLLPSKVLVSRAVDTRSSEVKIKSEVYDLHNWQHWMTDAKGGKGDFNFDSARHTLQIGPTKIRIIASSDSTVTTLWVSSTEMTGTFHIIDHHRSDSLITIQWQMEQDVKWYPWQKFASITKDEIWGASMEKSLDNLKALLENQ